MDDLTLEKYGKAKAYCEIAMTYERHGRNDMAEKYYEASRNADPKYIPAYVGLARFNRGNSEKQVKRRLWLSWKAMTLSIEKNSVRKDNVIDPEDPAAPGKLYLALVHKQLHDQRNETERLELVLRLTFSVVVAVFALALCLL